MSLFGGDKREGKNAALRAEIERVNELSIDDLAIEAMTKAFGPEGLAPGGGTILASDASGAFIQGDSTWGLDRDALVEIDDLVAEGIQRLEHAGMVRMIVADDDSHNSHTYMTTTRAGRAALASNSVDKALKASV